MSKNAENDLRARLQKNVSDVEVAESVSGSVRENSVYRSSTVSG